MAAARRKKKQNAAAERLRDGKRNGDMSFYSSLLCDLRSISLVSTAAHGRLERKTASAADW